MLIKMNNYNCNHHCNIYFCTLVILKPGGTVLKARLFLLCSSSVGCSGSFLLHSHSSDGSVSGFFLYEQICADSQLVAAEFFAGKLFFPMRMAV